MKKVFEKIRQYNVWDTGSIHTGFERTAYIEKLSGYVGSKLVKILIGQRRVGKSYLLRQIINYLLVEKNVNPKNIFYVNKEYTAFDKVKNARDLEDLFQIYEMELNVSGKIYLFLDEIQDVEQWENFVNSYAQDFTADYEFFITGSNSKLLSGELASLLSGRYVQFEIFSFGFEEFTNYKQLPVNKETYLKYLQTGGLPELLRLQDDEIRQHYVESLKNTIILKDIVLRHQIKDVSLLEDIFKFLTVNVGNPVSVASIVAYFKSQQKKTNYETVSSYLHYLKNALIFHEVERYRLRGKKVLGGIRKYYLNDLAFKNYLFGYYPSDIGYNLENLVYLELKRKGYKIHIGQLDAQEIDFVAIKKDKTIYLQVAYLLSSEKTIEREFGNLLKIKDNHEKMVISLDDIQFSGYEGIKHFRPWELEGQI